MKKYTEITFGNFQKKLSGLLDDVESQTNAALAEQTNYLMNAFNDEIEVSTGEIWDLLDDYNVVYEGDKIFVLDKLPKDEAVNVILIDEDGISISKTGIHGAFYTVFSIDGALDLTPLDLVKWSVIELGKAKNWAGQAKLFDDANTLLYGASKDGVKIYGQNNCYAVSNGEYFLAVYDKDNNLVFSLKNNILSTQKGSFSEELAVGNKLRFLTNSSGAGIYLT